ncbi:AT-hook motif nuclear-localized protein 5-like [Bidens hawaiensis]|uniref:AT-hook motif nuclear-localized protein 5-like n=1 Tax=Bidens hawaiensis TaxID=980011 RepID=UPI0040494341
MDARDGMPSFYLGPGVFGSGSVVGSGSGSYTGGAQDLLGFLTQANPDFFHNHNNIVDLDPIGSSYLYQYPYLVEQTPPPTFHDVINISDDDVGGGGGSGGAVVSDPGMRKRGRPRIYNVDGSDMSAPALNSASSARGSHGSGIPIPKQIKGRPPGSGRVQMLANAGEWMYSSAGLAFTPHVIFINTGEDVAEKIYSFAQQRPRGVCIISAVGSVSEVQLRKLPSSAGTVTYEGPFHILSLSGSYLVPESGAPNSRTGGLSISVSSPDIDVLGGAIGGRLIASSMVQVVAFSFVYGGKNSKKAKGAPSAKEKSPSVQPNDTNPAPSQAIPLTQDAPARKKKVYTEIDLTYRG